MVRYSHFGPKVKDVLALLGDGEKIIFDSQEIRVTFSLQGVKGPGVVVSWQKKLSKGRLVFTDARVIGTSGGYKLIDFPLAELSGERVKVDKSQSDRFILTVSLQGFRPNWQGEMNLAYHIQPQNIPS